MQKLALDSDAYIKLYKIGALEEICNSFECLMTGEVYGETVIAGLKHFREEAEAFKRMIDAKKITLVDAKRGEPEEQGIGLGEASVLNACLKLGCVAVSDDRRFLSILANRRVSFHTPASLIVAMHESKLINKNKAVAALEKLRLLSNNEVVEKALKEVGGE